MDAFLQWLSTNPIISTLLVSVTIVAVLAVTGIYVKAFAENRPLSFWPPKIGTKPEQIDKPGETPQSGLPLAASTFFLTNKELDTQSPFVDLVACSEDLMIGGVALTNAVKRHRSQLLTQLERGGRLRFMVLDPDSPDVQSMETMYGVPPQLIKSDIEVTLRNLEVLLKSKTTKSGSIEIRLFGREPAFSFTICNPKSPNGLFTAGIRAYGERSTTRPYWILRPSDKWFSFFVQSCENMWNDSQPWPKLTQPKPIAIKAGVVAYRTTKDKNVEVLLITARKRPNNWIFPVGTVDTGETLQETAARECAEESGYTVDIGSKIDTIEIDEGEFVNRMTFFIARVNGETKLYESDRQRRWVLQTELLDCVAENFQPIARAALVKLAD